MPTIIRAILPDDPMIQWVMFVLAMVGLSFAGQWAAHVLDRTGRSARRAIGYLLPVAVGTLMAMIWGRPQMALAIVTGSAVGALMAAGGIAMLMCPVQRLAPGIASLVRFVLPVGLLLLLAGFSGHFGWIHAGIFAIEGLALYAVFGAKDAVSLAGDDEPASPDPHDASDARAEANLTDAIDANAPVAIDVDATAAQTTDETAGNAPAEKPGRSSYSQAKKSATSPLVGGRVAFGGAVLLAMVCGLMMMGSVMSPTSDLARVPQDLLGATVLAPILLLSCIGGVTTTAQHGRGADALAQVSAVALLAICFLLPVSIAFYRIQPALPGFFSPAPLVHVEADYSQSSATSPASTGPASTGPASTRPADEGELDSSADDAAHAARQAGRWINPPVLYPTLSWRLDAPLMCAVGMLLLGLSLGKLPLTQRTGLLLLIGYVLYLMIYAGGSR